MKKVKEERFSFMRHSDAHRVDAIVAMTCGLARASLIVVASSSRGRGGRGRGARGGGRGRGGRSGGRGRGADSRDTRPVREGARTSRANESSRATESFVGVDDAVVERNLRAISDVAKTLARRGEASRLSGGEGERYEGDGFRLVRCMPQLKRREADAAVSAGRVLVNGELVRPSQRVRGGDVVTLDGRVMRWEPYARAVEAELRDDAAGGTSRFVYLAYNKPRGVVCTMEPGQRTSLHYVLERERKRLNGARVFPVGRLDKDSSGLVLLTNDGRVSDALLDPSRKAEKEYDVDVDREVSEDDARRLAAGVVITTTQQRGMEETTAATQPCRVTKIGARSLRFVLKEGRNRQIRKMCEALTYDVRVLHRTRIDSLRLGDLEIGGVRPLDEEELQALSARVRARAEASKETKSQSSESRRRQKAIDANPDGWGAKILEGQQFSKKRAP